MNNFHTDSINSILFDYLSYKEKSIEKKWVRYHHVKEFLAKYKNANSLKIEKLGESFEGRDIDLVTLGSGKTKIFMWSQMHGDESTSTRALMDLTNFLNASDENQHIRDLILSSVTLYIIPMLNPDGAEKFQRRNAQQIDINRDAILQQSPEAEILYKAKNKIEPDYGFNLHDQSSGYSAGITYKSSTISLLAPPVNYKNELTENVVNAMKLVLAIKEFLDSSIPGHVARYDDEFEPRAFGDNFAKDGTTTILIEAGGWQNDPERECVRKIYFTALLKSLLTISDNTHLNLDHENYFSIPENKERLFDLILRNVRINSGKYNYTADIAIKYETEVDISNQKIFVRSEIADIGDLSTFHGYYESNFSEYELELPKISNESDISELGFSKILQNGVAFVKKANSKGILWTPHPVNYFTYLPPQTELKIDQPANFFLKNEKKIKFAVINGFLIDLSKKIRFNGNGLIMP